MAIQLPFGTLIFVLCCFCYFYYFWSQKHRRIHSSLPKNWPIFRMLPDIIRNVHRLHEYGTEFLAETGGTFEFKGPWFSNLQMVFTSDPANIQYILTNNFSNYPKGPEFRKLFDILGDGIFSTDSELWEIHRRANLSVLHNPNFLKSLELTVLEKVEKGLFPVLENYVYRGSPVDLQDIFQRFSFDSISRLVLDYDPKSLSADLPYTPLHRAFNDTEEAVYWRHFLPETFWMLQKLLGVGKERKLSEAWKAFDEFIFPRIDLEQQQQQRSKEEESHFDSKTAFIEAYELATTKKKSGAIQITKLFLRDMLLNLMFAGRDTTSTALTWFFFLLKKHPYAESNILQEIESSELSFQRCQNNKHLVLLDVEESHKLVYLHAALCETLRLYPPVAFNHKTPIKADILPSGVRVNPKTKLILCFYSMGRMESVWGRDCLEFKPERWISEGGKIKHEPAYKFPAFNAGPRTCLGKEMTFVQMKMVAASIIYNYKVRLVDGHPVSPTDAIVIQMKHGLKVTISNRN